MRMWTFSLFLFLPLSVLGKDFYVTLHKSRPLYLPEGKNPSPREGLYLPKEYSVFRVTGISENTIPAGEWAYLQGFNGQWLYVNKQGKVIGSVQKKSKISFHVVSTSGIISRLPLSNQRSPIHVVRNGATVLLRTEQGYLKLTQKGLEVTSQASQATRWKIFFTSRPKAPGGFRANFYMFLPPVPPQRDSWSCGPNTATRLLNFYRIPATYEEMKKLAKKNVITARFNLGTPPPGLAKLLKKKGLDSTWENQSHFTHLLYQIRWKKPVICLMRSGTQRFFFGLIRAPRLHWIVVVGFANAGEQIHYYDTTSNALYTYPYSTFYKKWDWRARLWVIQKLLEWQKVKKRSLVHKK